MTRAPRSALILGCDERSGLSVIRSLGRAGIDVDAAWLGNEIVARSRYIRDIVHIPTPVEDPTGWFDALIQHLQKVRYDLVVPCNDLAIIPLQKLATALEPYAALYTLGDRAFAACFDKEKTAALAEECGVRMPRWSVVRTPQEIGSALAAAGIPAVLKPISSVDLEAPSVHRRVKIVRDAKDLEHTLRRMFDTSHVLVQSYFEGRGVGVELLVRDGKVQRAFQHERVHEMAQGGGSSYRRSVPLRNELLGASAALARALDYTGVMMVEFRVNAKTGDWILVEINGRFWGSLPLAQSAGVDFPLYLYEMLTCGRTDFSGEYLEYNYSRNLFADMLWFREKLSEGNLRALNPVNALRVLGRCIAGRERIDSWAWDDFAPARKELGLIFLVLRSFLGRSLSRLSGYNALARSRRRGRAMSLIGGAKSVLFVCKGNICRSPFAEVLARAHASRNMSFASAGTLSLENRASPNEARSVAREFDLDLSAHRSHTLSPALVDGTDAIVVFDEENYRKVTSAYPRIVGKVVRLADLCAKPIDEIPDPIGESEDVYRRCYMLIADALFQAGLLKTRVAPRTLPASGVPRAGD